jgi:hypothetical protein
MTGKRKDSMRKNRRKEEGLGKKMPKIANRFWFFCPEPDLEQDYSA